jgi:nucleoside-diphosphate-sugar epimerase
MKVLVTGGAGFVGSTLVPLLLQEGHDVTVVDNLMYRQETLLGNASSKSFHFVFGDVRDEEAMKQVVRGADVIIHLAAIVGEPACRTHPDLAKSVNLQASKLINNLRSKNQRFIFASTGSNYGKVEGICTEETPLNPLSLYGVTKTEAEKVFLEKGNCVIYRFATGFGISPRLRLDLLPNDFTFRAVHDKYLIVYDKGFRRTFIHVRDMAKALNFALIHFETMKDSAFNAGHESMNFSKEDVANKIKERTDFFLTFAPVGHDPDQRDYEASYAKIRAQGYSTDVSMDDGIDELMRAFRMMRIVNPHTNLN